LAVASSRSNASFSSFFRSADFIMAPDARANQSCATSKVAAKVRSQKPKLDFYSAL
jgi:hypothetical protein